MDNEFNDILDLCKLNQIEEHILESPVLSVPSYGGIVSLRHHSHCDNQRAIIAARLPAYMDMGAHRKTLDALS